MKRKLIITSIVIAVPNIPVIGTDLILKKIDGDHFRYANNNASFTSVEYIDSFSPWMDKWVMWFFIEDQRPTSQNMEVFRLYKINPLCFWRWRYYIGISRHFGYKSWKDIKPNRVPYDPENHWQDF